MSQVKKEGFEAQDFKINFSISVIASLNKQKVVFYAQEKLGLTFEAYEKGGKSVDFKEVFKWICSPLLAKALDLPPALEGPFNVHCLFLLKDNAKYLEERPQYYENLINTKVNLELSIYSYNAHQGKRKSKW